MPRTCLKRRESSPEQQRGSARRLRALPRGGCQGALLDKDTDKIIIWLPKVGAKKLFESYIKRRIAHFQAEIEKSETLDNLTEVAERIRSAKLLITEDAAGLFAQEKSRLLGLIEDKFGGTVKL